MFLNKQISCWIPDCHRTQRTTWATSCNIRWRIASLRSQTRKQKVVCTDLENRHVYSPLAFFFPPNQNQEWFNTKRKEAFMQLSSSDRLGIASSFFHKCVVLWLLCFHKNYLMNYFHLDFSQLTIACTCFYYTYFSFLEATPINNIYRFCETINKVYNCQVWFRSTRNKGPEKATTSYDRGCVEGKEKGKGKRKLAIDSLLWVRNSTDLPEAQKLMQWHRNSSSRWLHFCFCGA